MRPRPPDPPPSLCTQGPCRHYHEFTVEFAAADAIAERVSDGSDGESHGRLMGHGDQSMHMETHRYCYPTHGVETRLGSLAVLRCNRWHPAEDSDTARAALLYKRTAQWGLYAAAISRWNNERAAKLRHDQEAATAANIIMGEMPKETP